MQYFLQVDLESVGYNKLKMFLSDIIDDNRNAFVPGRVITDILLQRSSIL